MYRITCKTLKTSVLVTLMLVLGACANTVARDSSKQNIVKAKSAITEAVAAGATNSANPKLASARAHVVSADKALKNKKYDVANRHSELAESDAKLAAANAQTAIVQQNASNIESDIKRLKSKIELNEQTQAELAQ